LRLCAKKEGAKSHNGQPRKMGKKKEEYYLDVLEKGTKAYGKFPETERLSTEGGNDHFLKKKLPGNVRKKKPAKVQYFLKQRLLSGTIFYSTRTNQGNGLGDIQVFQTSQECKPTAAPENTRHAGGGGTRGGRSRQSGGRGWKP